MSCASVLRADASRIPLADQSVDLIVTSPPYFALRSYQDGGEHYHGQLGSEPTPQAFLEALWAVTSECWRVLKPCGSMFLNLGDKYSGSGGHNNGGISKPRPDMYGTKAAAVDGITAVIASTRRNAPDSYNKASDGIRAKSLMGLPWRYAIGCIDGRAAPGGQQWVLRAEIVWSKPNGLPESVQDRVRRSHEQWFHLTKSERYYSAVDEIREQHVATATGRNTDGWRPGPSGMNRSTATGRTHDDGEPLRYFALSPLGKLPGSVWTVPSEPLTIPDTVQQHYQLPDHFAAFPQEFPRRFILGWSPPHGVILDPFGGTGSVAGVARMLGRTGINLDLSADYCRLARWRIYRSGHFHKTAARTNAERQGGLFTTTTDAAS